MGIKSKYIALALMGVAMANTNIVETRKAFNPPAQPKKAIPKGCEEFKFYDDHGNTFTCVALTKESAKKKFNKWLKNNALGSKLRPNTLKSF